MKQSYQTRLDEMVTRYLAREYSFDAFQQAYSACYADEDADRDFTDEEADYYGSIHEYAEWTTTAPSQSDREVGWLDVGEFTSWLTQHVRSRSGSH